MITLSAPTFDLNGVVEIPLYGEQTDVSSVSRRLTRTALLDGGVSIYDGGYSAGDRTFVVDIPNLSESDDAAIRYLLKNYSLLYVSTAEGVFSAAPDSFDVQNGRGRLRLLVKDQLSE